jgi:hypothetical protein
MINSVPVLLGVADIFCISIVVTTPGDGFWVVSVLHPAGDMSDAEAIRLTHIDVASQKDSDSLSRFVFA